MRDNADFRLSSEDEQELFVALQEIRRGNYVDGHDLLRELKHTGDKECGRLVRTAARSDDALSS